MFLDVGTLTIIHTALSFIALALGMVAVMAFFAPTPRIWTELFLAAAVATTVTGFLFPLTAMTPAVATGIVASLVFAAMFAARFVFRLAGAWRFVYAAGMVTSLYLLVFVAIAQAFLKIPSLQALAPTGSEPPFAVAQLVNLAVFVWIGRKAVRRFGSGSAMHPQAA